MQRLNGCQHKHRRNSLWRAFVLVRRDVRQEGKDHKIGVPPVTPCGSMGTIRMKSVVSATSLASCRFKMYAVLYSFGSSCGGGGRYRMEIRQTWCLLKKTKIFTCPLTYTVSKSSIHQMENGSMRKLPCL